ncbi:MAG: Asp-tRNA(Asn)/Glu-tRNA(Gln) amidotransferase GatCAB subunit B, partial [Planctomycetaceae bacterium]
SADYRYFPDPDLLPVRIPREQIEALRESLGELPAATRQRLESSYQIKPYDADVIVNQGLAMIRYFETVADTAGDGKRASNWIQQDVMRTLKERGETIVTFPISAASLGDLLRRVVAGALDNARARNVFAQMLHSGESVAAAIAALGIETVDSSALDSLCRELLDANPQVVDDFRNGKQQALGSLIGQAKKANPNASPQLVRETLLRIVQTL